jgi:hypothetical protein
VAAHQQRCADNEARTRATYEKNNNLWEKEKGFKDRSIAKWEKQEQLREKHEKERQGAAEGKTTAAQLLARRQQEVCASSPLTVLTVYILCGC